MITLNEHSVGATPFRLMQTGRAIDLKTYLARFLQARPECTLHVGTDSQNVRHFTVYASVIVLRYPNMGAHVLYRREKVPKIEDSFVKLWGETERSVNLACYLRDDCRLKVAQIDLDFNTNPEYFSNRLLQASSGYITAMGFKSAAKPELLMATWAANVLCQI